jgi:hypothetical protein
LPCPWFMFSHDLECYCTKQIKWNRIISQTGVTPEN